MREVVHAVPELLLSPEHSCPYLPGKTARTLFLDPRVSQHPAYDQLLAQGFRRNGAYYYRPQCAGCRACIPLRIPANDFTPDRSQRRIVRRNRELSVNLLPAAYRDEHYDLYLCYQRWKHPNGGMDQSSPQDYASFLMAPPANTLMAEIRLQQKLVAVAVMDLAADALSAVYTFYAPEYAQHSPGTYCILWEIEEARQRRLAWVYLGYWIAASPKMAYKSHFLPHEILTLDGWRRISRNRA